MNDEYPIAGGYKIAGFIFAGLAFSGGIYFLYSAVRSTGSLGLFTTLALGIVLIYISIYFYRYSRFLRVTVDELSLETRDAFYTKSILLKDIDGYRDGEKEAFYIVAKGSGKNIKIESSLARRKELIEWIKGKYSNVDDRARKAEEKIILQDERYGATTEERREALKKASKAAGISYFVSFVLFFWAVAFPRPFDLLMILLLLAPWVGGYFMWRSKGLMRFTPTKSSPYPSVSFVMVLSVIGLALDVFRGYELYDFPFSTWLLIGGGAVALTLAASAAFRESIAAETNKAVVVFSIFVVTAFYSYGLILFSNCYGDHSAAQVWQVPVMGKHVSHGKSTTYYLRLGPWGKYTDGKQITVGSSFYGAVNPEDTVSVFLKKGRWGIPWFTVFRYGN